jgi:hypothetical protein
MVQVKRCSELNVVQTSVRFPLHSCRYFSVVIQLCNRKDAIKYFRCVIEQLYFAIEVNAQIKFKAYQHMEQKIGLSIEDKKREI